MVVDSSGSDHSQSEGIGLFLGFNVEVEHHLHVVADETDRYHDNVNLSRLFDRLQSIGDIGFAPGLTVGGVVALLHQLPGVDSQFLTDQTTGVLQLCLVVGSFGHR